MLLNHHKHRAYRSSHAKSSSNDVTIWKLMKGDSKDPDPPEPEKTAEEQTSMRLEKALLDSRKELKVMKTKEKRPQLVSLKGKSPFKKRVEEFYKRRDSITLQQKLNSLAPTTINNLTMIVTRNDPITTASFLATPYNKQTKVNQRFNTPSIQRNDASKLNQRFLLSRAASQQGYMLSEEEEDGRSEKFFIRPLEKQKTKKMTKNKSLSQEIIETLDRTGLQISSYNSIDKDIDALIDKNLNASMYQPKKNFVEYSKIKIEANIESEPNFNFKAASTKNLDNADSEFQPKEGSFLKHLRTQSVQPSLFPTKSQAAELSVKSHSNKNFAQKRTRSVQNNRNKNSNSSINNEETGLDVSNIFGSYRVPDSSKPLISGKPMNSRHQRIIDSQDQVNNRMISPFLSGQVTQKSMLSIITPNKLNDNSHIEEELNISAIEYPEHNETIKLVSASNIQEISLENNNETITKPEDVKDQKENKLQNQIATQTRTNTLQLQFCENTTMTRNLTELLSYAKQKSQILEDIIQHDIQDIKSMKKDTFSVEEAQAEARISYIQGGISQKTVKIDNIEREKDVPLLLEADTKEARAVREEVIKVNTKFESIEKKKEELYTQCKDKLEQAKMVAPQRLTNYEIYLIRNEFEKRPDNLDIEKIDLSLKKLRFFSQLSKEIRTNFYKNAQFFKFEKDDYIYRQCDSGDLMYVILRGNVNIKVDKIFENGHSQLNPNYYTSLNDGYHFGDLAVIGEKYRTKQSQNSETKVVEVHDDKPGQRTTSIPEKLAALTKLMNQTLQKSWTSESKRKASSTQTLRQNSALCAEETEVIAIDRELFQEIIFSDAQKGLDAKIEVLQISYFFRGEESFNLMPIANILKTEKFKLGQRIIKAGDLIDNFYIVAKGRCKVISQIPDGYPLNLDMFKQKLRILNFKTPKKTRKNKTENLNIQKPTETSTLEKRIFDREPLIANGINNFSADKSKKFVKHIKHKELARGDCFGIRSLLKAGDDDSSTIDDKCLIAKLSVVADTSDVEVYVLPRISLILVPEEIRNNLLNLIAETNDFDELDTSEDIIEHRKWRKYQLGIIKKALTKTDDTNLSLVHTTYKST